MNNSAGNEPEPGRQLITAVVVGELILESSVSPFGIKHLGLPRIVKVELIPETK